MCDATPHFAMVDICSGTWQRWSTGLQARSTHLPTRPTRVKERSTRRPTRPTCVTACSTRLTYESILDTYKYTYDTHSWVYMSSSSQFC